MTTVTNKPENPTMPLNTDMQHLANPIDQSTVYFDSTVTDFGQPTARFTNGPRSIDQSPTNATSPQSNSKLKVPLRETVLLIINRTYLATCLVLLFSYIIMALAGDKPVRIWGYLGMGFAANFAIPILIVYIVVALYSVTKKTIADHNARKRIKLLSLGALTTPLTLFVPVICYTFLGFALNTNSLIFALISAPAHIAIIALSILCLALGILNIVYIAKLKWDVVKNDNKEHS